MKIITKGQVAKRVEQLGCTWKAEYQGRTPTVAVDAPVGKVFISNDCHSLDASCFDGKGAWAYLYGEIFGDLVNGLRDCTEDDCENCHVKTCTDPECKDGAHDWNEC